MDPFTKYPTINVHCNVVDPTKNNAPYEKDPRHILAKCDQHLTDSGIADHARIGPEAEFFLFDDVRYSVGQKNMSFYEVDGVEGDWNMGRQEEGGNLAYKSRAKEGYFP